MARPIDVFYGSQTGNAQALAESIHAECERKGWPASLWPMNDFKKMAVPLEECGILVFVCSTTGNGDAPSNADRCWRHLKKRSHPKDLMAASKFTVLGLGDTNYNKFCALGIGIDKRMSELGATRFYPLGCADEGTGLEDVIEPWLEGFWPALEALLAAPAKDDAKSAEGDDLEGEPEPGNLPEPVEAKEAFSLEGEPEVKELDDGTTVPVPPEIPQTELSVFNLALPPADLERLEATYAAKIRRDLGLPADPATDPWRAEDAEGAGDLPRLARVKNLVELAPPPGATHEDDLQNWTLPAPAAPAIPSLEAPALASVADARFLTRPAKGDVYGFAERRVVHVSLDLSRGGAQPVPPALGGYVPGDAIGVLAPNAPDLVGLVLARLRRDHATPPETQVTAAGTTTDGRYAEPQSLAMAVKFRVDLQTTPRRKILRQLAEHCQEDADRWFLERLCSKAAAQQPFQKAWLQDRGLRTGDLFGLCPSLSPPADVLLSLLPGALPRYYSIASSPLASRGEGDLASRMSLACSVVEYELAQEGDTEPVKRRGLATTWLEGLVQRHAGADGGDTAAKTASHDLVPLFLHPTREFVLPAHPRWPILCIGPGTGVAPFLGFLAHRHLNQQRKREACSETSAGCWRGDWDLDVGEGEEDAITSFTSGSGIGEAWLAFGCRHRGRDFIYEEEITAMERDGAIQKLLLAFSRDESETDGCHKHVTHALAAEAAAVAKLLRLGCAYVYICGDGTQMAQDVHNTLVRCLGAAVEVLEGDMAPFTWDRSVQELWQAAKVPEAQGGRTLDGLSPEEAEAFLQVLMKRGRYVQDVWS